MKNKDLSERSEARRAGLSRTTLRGIRKAEINPTVRTLERLALSRGEAIQVFSVPLDATFDSSYSTAVASQTTVQNGFDSWKIHFFDFVDEVMRRRDYRLVILPPVNALDTKLKTLMAAVVLELCHQLHWSDPDWAIKAPRLKRPWFVSGIENLKASAILESPLRFKLKNIYVLNNFLERV